MSNAVLWILFAFKDECCCCAMCCYRVIESWSAWGWRQLLRSSPALGSSPTLLKQGYPDRVVQICVQTGLNYLQIIIRQPGPVFGLPHSKYLKCFTLCSCPVSEVQSLAFILLHRVFIDIDKDPHEPSPLQAGQSQLSQHLLIWEMLQSSNHLCDPVLGHNK